jgi:LacI family transcriptional regulator
MVRTALKSPSTPRAGNGDSACPHVALLVETSLASGRDILRGIGRYVREHRPWALFHEPRSLEESGPRWLKNWKGDGIIARVQNRQIADLVRQTRLPVVDVLGLVPEAGIPLVHVDDREIARLAAEHLRERGFRHFGYYGLADENWSVRRRDYFRNWLGSAGRQLAVCEQPRHDRSQASWENRENELARWICSLPKPVGVMVCSDQRGLDFLEACRRARVTVPDAVAVVGVDNDEALCEIAHPPLSSVWPAHNQVGYEAAALLDRLMQGGRPPTAPILIAPSGVKTRQSTDVLAIADPNISQALRVIREQGCLGIGVDDVSAAAGLSRSVLQRRFRKILGKTVHQEILNIRLQRACTLLTETALPLIEVAEQAGFTHQEYLGVVFRTRFGKTPAQFRREAGDRPRSPLG